MCEDIDYEVVADIEALPSRLPTLYRKLTEYMTGGCSLNRLRRGMHDDRPIIARS